MLIFFFIVPLFGMVILGMLWKRATPAGGFWGFLTAILFSIGMWVFVHTFPDGYRPAAQGGPRQWRRGVGRERPDGDEDHASHRRKRRGQDHERGHPARSRQDAGCRRVADLVPQTGLTLAATQATRATGQDACASSSRTPSTPDTKEHAKFGVEGVPLVLKPGVTIQAAHVSKKFDAAAFNPAHTKYIARSDKAKGMAVNMYSGFWSLVVCMAVTILVSLFTKPKPEAELKDLVFGLTKMPDRRAGPWYASPKLWAAVVFVVLVAINIIFW